MRVIVTLIINKNHDLATLGSLSYRFNVGPIQESNETIEEVQVESEDDNKDLESQKDDLDKCREELKKCQETNRRLVSDYNKCEKELRNKTEEVEKLKTELNLIKQTIELKKDEKSLDNEGKMNLCNICAYRCKSKDEMTNHIKSVHTNDKHLCQICNSKFRNKPELNEHISREHTDDSPEVTKHQTAKEHTKTKTTNNVPIEIFRCIICGFISKSKDELFDHIKRKHTNIEKEDEYNCEGCDFQGTSMLQLNKHLNLKHIGENQPMREVIRCRICDEQFSQKWNLMNHRKEKHPEAVAFCRKKRDGNCPFSDEKCWWNHQNKNKESPLEIECFICGEIFERKSSLMRHRKLKHPTLVKKCEKFIKNDCQFQDSYCWWLHEEEAMELDESTNDDKKEEDEKENSIPVFQKPSLNIKPPIKKQKEE